MLVKKTVWEIFSFFKPSTSFNTSSFCAASSQSNFLQTADLKPCWGANGHALVRDSPAGRETWRAASWRPTRDAPLTSRASESSQTLSGAELHQLGAQHAAVVFAAAVVFFFLMTQLVKASVHLLCARTHTHTHCWLQLENERRHNRNHFPR